MRKKGIGSEVIGVGITAMRYVFAERMARNLERGQNIAQDMATVVLADVVDGAVLRKFDMDTPARRLADGAIDYLSINRVGRSVATQHPETKPFFNILAARTLLVGGLNTFHKLKTGEVTKSSNRHRLTTLSTAAFVLTAVEGNQKATKVAGSLMIGIAAMNLPNYFHELGNKHASGYREV